MLFKHSHIIKKMCFLFKRSTKKHFLYKTNTEDHIKLQRIDKITATLEAGN